ncbi:hypothetical protein PG5_63940 [Pseudomonas sp. G5(2012)]|nr:hypothetical protein PG5_63940 [Pseudomonas sp. G5(2012)]
MNGWHQFFSGGKRSASGVVAGEVGWVAGVGQTLGVLES